jgi:hypothetical protein
MHLLAETSRVVRKLFAPDPRSLYKKAHVRIRNATTLLWTAEGIRHLL